MTRAPETYLAFKLAGPLDVRDGSCMWAIDADSPQRRPVARCLGKEDAERIVAALQRGSGDQKASPCTDQDGEGS